MIALSYRNVRGFRIPVRRVGVLAEETQPAAGEEKKTNYWPWIGVAVLVGGVLYLATMPKMRSYGGPRRLTA